MPEKKKTSAQKPRYAAATKPTTNNRTGSWRYEKPVFIEGSAPCSEACPLGEDIPTIMALYRAGKIDEACSLIREDNPFPGICGQICFHPCEQVCNRGRFDQAVSIRDLEKFAAYAAEITPDRPRIRIPKEAKRAAVAANGIAGLSYAYFMRLLGHRVTIFEPRSAVQKVAEQIGRQSLDLDHLALEVGRIEAMGVEFVSEVRMQKDVIARLTADYDALYVTKKMHAAMQATTTDWMAGTLHSSKEVQARFKTGSPPKLSGKVAVVGGGSQAVETAVALKHGGVHPIVFFSGSPDSIVAPAPGADQTQTTGIEFEFNTAVYGITYRRKGRPALLCRKKPTGHRSDETVTTFDSECDHVISTLNTSLSSGSLLPLVGSNAKVAFVEPTLEKGKASRKTVQAIAAGKRAAFLTDMSLRHVGIDEIREHFIGRLGAISTAAYCANQEKDNRRMIKKIVHYHELNLSDVRSSRRNKPQKSDGIYSIPEAKRAAARCFSCGICTFCNKCYDYCPDVAIAMDKKKHFRAIDYDFCKGCGICARECPRGAILWCKQ